MSDCTVASLRTPSRFARRSRSAWSWPSSADSVATPGVYHDESLDVTNRGSLFRVSQAQRPGDSRSANTGSDREELSEARRTVVVQGDGKEKSHDQPPNTKPHDDTGTRGPRTRTGWPAGGVTARGPLPGSWLPCSD